MHLRTEESEVKFNEDDNCRILLGNLTSTSVGLNLIVANKIIFNSPFVKRKDMENNKIKGQSTMKRILKYLIEFYPVLLPVTCVCIIFSAITDVSLNSLLAELNLSFSCLARTKDFTTRIPLIISCRIEVALEFIRHCLK